MRVSSYTISAPAGEGEHVLYNSASGAFALLDDEAFARFESGASDDATLAGELLAAGFLTELDAQAELDEQRRRFAAQRADMSELGLVLAPTYACNYRCPYCYELGHNAIKGMMGEDVMSAVYRFIEARHAEHALSKLSVQWYGGDPSLALDVVETMSRHMIGWCDEHGVEYDALMLTNCNLIDEAAADMLAEMRVTSVFITIDGLEETHNARRVAANGSNSFERNVAAAKLFAERGITVTANMNMDRVNRAQYRELRDLLMREAGVELGFGRLCDYGGFFGTRGFQAPAFDLLTHEEFCRISHEEFAARSFDAATLQALLEPQSRFCNGQRDNYFVIDCKGDVYACDGYIGEQDWVRFNVLDEPTREQLHEVTFEPCEDALCSSCEIMPLCWGNCIWERRKTGLVCHPLRTTIGDYLRDWRTCYPIEANGYTRLS